MWVIGEVVSVFCPLTAKPFVMADIAPGKNCNREKKASVHRTQAEAEKAAKRQARTSDEQGSSIEPLSEEKRQALVEDARRHVRASQHVYDGLARE